MTNAVALALLAVASLAAPALAQPVPDPPLSRGEIRGFAGKNGRIKLNERTATMLAHARGWLAGHGGCPAARATPAWITQGSYSANVEASAGTHDGGGTFDMSVAGLTGPQKQALVRALREAGFAAWLRGAPSFVPHIHAVAIGDPDLPRAARAQVADYFAGKDGLAGRRRDPHGGPIIKAWMEKFGARVAGITAALSGATR